MRKLLLGAILLFSTIGFTQVKTEVKKIDVDSIYIKKYVDIMTDKTYLFPSKKIVLLNDNNKMGFSVRGEIRNGFKFDGISVKQFGIGNCDENDELIILFDNGSKIIKKSWNEFNCEGNSYFNLNQDDINLLRKQTISKIRLTNGRTYESYTGDVEKSSKRYFIQLFYAIDNNLSTTATLSK
mgnify:FL=1